MSVEELGEIGLSEMGDEEIDGFLATQRSGVLALPGDGAPYLVPLSFGYNEEGDGTVYFAYALGADSTKERLSDRASVARFLVYTADSQFRWESVLLGGPIERLPREAWDGTPLGDAWRPALLRDADLSRGAAVYRLDVAERTGIRHAGLPPGFEQ
jgi:nitroimidazol reductase NimA-like FMN-containing flavoprotein (pyridoxamine 5'-phosphate oxidase superfamily)